MSDKRPPGHTLPQKILKGTRRRSLRSDVITFEWNIFGLLELSFIVAVPREDGASGPVFVRFFIDRAKEDKPGSVIIE